MSTGQRDGANSLAKAPFTYVKWTTKFGHRNTTIYIRNKQAPAQCQPHEDDKESDIQNTEPWTAINMTNSQTHTMEEINFRNTTQSEKSQAWKVTLCVTLRI